MFSKATKMMGIKLVYWVWVPVNPELMYEHLEVLVVEKRVGL